MPPLRDYSCLDCGHDAEELIRSSADEPTECPVCKGKQYIVQVSAHGGYSMMSGPSSVRPRGAGSFKRKK